MNLLLEHIVSYFRYLCAQHPDLNHSEQAGQRVFEAKAHEEAFGDFRGGGQEKTYFVRFILPTMRYERSGDNARKTYQCGLMVGCYYSRKEDESTALTSAQSSAERVADDFVARMVADSRAGYALFRGSVDNVDALNLQGDFWDAQGDGSYGAVMYLFDMAVFRCLDAQTTAAAWLDDGETPVDLLENCTC